MRLLDLLSMAAVGIALSWCVFDLAARASDPYDIHSRQRIAPAGGITGHGERGLTTPNPGQLGLTPKAQGVADHTTARELSALDSPAFPASFAGSIATRDQDQEVTPAPGRIERPALYPPVQIKTREKRDGHSRALNPKEPNEENLSVSQAERRWLKQDQAVAGSIFEPARPNRGSGPVIAREVGGADRTRNDGNVGDQVSRLQRSRVGRRAVSKGEQVSPDFGQWVKVEISTYSRSYHGNVTHSGERYDHHRGHTAATTIIGRRWVLPNGSTWEVEHLGKTITVRINDTGSWRPKRAPYWLDLSGAAWRDLTGIAPSRKVARMRRVK